MAGQIVSLRLGDGREVELADWDDMPLFSAIDVMNGTTAQEMIAFGYVGGDPVPAYAPPAATTVTPRTANELDTNMAVPGALSVQEEMIVFAIRPEVQCLSVSDAANPDFQNPAALSAAAGDATANPGTLLTLNLRTMLILEISEKRFANAGFGYYNFGAGVMITGGDSTAGLVNGLNGLPSQEAVRSLAIPASIGGTEKFLVELLNPDGAALEIGYNLQLEADPAIASTRFARIRFYLDGLHRRGTA